MAISQPNSRPLAASPAVVNASGKGIRAEREMIKPCCLETRHDELPKNSDAARQRRTRQKIKNNIYFIVLLINLPASTGRQRHLLDSHRQGHCRNDEAWPNQKSCCWWTRATHRTLCLCLRCRGAAPCRRTVGLASGCQTGDEFLGERPKRRSFRCWIRSGLGDRDGRSPRQFRPGDRGGISWFWSWNHPAHHPSTRWNHPVLPTDRSSTSQWRLPMQLATRVNYAHPTATSPNDGKNCHRQPWRCRSVRGGVFLMRRWGGVFRAFSKTPWHRSGHSD